MPRESSAHGSIKGDKKSGFRGSITIDGKRLHARGVTKGEVQNKLDAHVKAAAEAKEAAERTEAAALETAERAAAAARTWDAAFEGWITSSSHTVTTVQGHRKLVTGILSKSPWWWKTIADTTTAEITIWVNALTTKRGTMAKLNTKNMLLSIARNSAAYALGTGTFGLETNPTTAVKIVRRGVSQHIESMTRPEVEKVLRAAGEHSPRAAARWAIALHYGLRPAEVLGLTLDDVTVTPEWIELNIRATLVRLAGNAFTETLWVRQDAPKTRAGRRVIPIPRDSEAGSLLLTHLTALVEYRAANPLSSDQLAYVAALREGLDRSVEAGLAGTDTDKKLTLATDWLFPHPAHHYIAHSHDSDRALWKRIGTAAGLDLVPTRYTARHTAATHMLDAGADDVAVSEIMGHTDSDFTRNRYADALAERKKRLAASLYQHPRD